VSSSNTNGLLRISTGWSVSAGVGGSTTQEIARGAPAGSVVASRCCSGDHAALRVDKRWSPKVGFATVGTLTVPQSSANSTEDARDEWCHDEVDGRSIGCGELPATPNECDTDSRPAIADRSGPRLDRRNGRSQARSVAPATGPTVAP
jgi:hypothetical protein